jgi:hypothetical protein
MYNPRNVVNTKYTTGEARAQPTMRQRDKPSNFMGAVAFVSSTSSDD